MTEPKKPQDYQMTKEQAAKILEKANEETRQRFIQLLEAASQETGWTIGGQIFVTQQGTLAVNIVVVPKQQT